MIRRARATRWRALILGSAAVVALPGMARAHGVLRRSVPASGAHLGAAPRDLRLTFSERVELAVARLELLGPGDRPVALSPLRSGEVPTVIVADITGPLGAGTYTVAWQIAGRDGHPVRGRFRFTLAPGAAGLATPTADTAAESRAAGPVPSTAAPAGDTTAPVAGHHDPAAMPTGGAFDAESPLFAAARWLGFSAMLALTGAVGFARLVVPRGLRLGGAASALRWSAERARTLGLVAAGILLVAAALRLAAQSTAMHGANDAFDLALIATMVGNTTWGTGWLVQAGAALAAVAGLLLARRTPTAGWGLTAAAVAVLAVGAALSGHAVAIPGIPALAVASDAAHILGAGGWLGTLLAVLLVGLPSALREPADGRGPTAAALVNAFSPVALACAGVVAVTGLAAAWWHVGTLGALWTTPYGRTLLLKLAVLALVAGVGAYNWRRVRPALRDERGAQRLARSSTVELAIGAVVLAITAVLVATPTPVDAVR